MKVNVESTGPLDARDIVFVHGAGGSAATWFMQLRGLSLAFRVHAIELNGHGRSPNRGIEDTRSAYLEDIHSVVAEMDQPILGGHSMGGALTQLYALEHPDSLSGIILIGTGARLRVSPAIFDLLENDFDGYVQALGEFMFDKNADPRMVEASMAEAKQCKPEIIGRDFKMCDEFDIMDAVGQISLPCLIIAGESDLMTPVKYSQYLSGQISSSRLAVIPDAGHAVMLEKPREVNDEIRRWAKEVLTRD